MKISFIFFIALIISSAVSAAPRKESSKEGGTTSTTDSVAVENDSEISAYLANFANGCLKTVSSNMTVSSSDKTFIKKASDEIIKKLKEKTSAVVSKDNKLGRSIASVDSIQYPECFAFADETNNREILNQLGHKAPSTSVSQEIEPASSSISK